MTGSETHRAGAKTMHRKMASTALERASLALAVIVATSTASDSADLHSGRSVTASAKPPSSTSVSGRVVVIDGRTLVFAQQGLKVVLAGIDGCELPQWAFGPDADEPAGDRLRPVPCGALAKAWLERSIGDHPVECQIEESSNVRVGRCTAGDLDLALELLRVGWARMATGKNEVAAYRLAEKRAVAARFGMWDTYVLDMSEWRREAVDRTMNRRPLADYNLLRERRGEISPPFADARHLPKRTDR